MTSTNANGKRRTEAAISREVLKNLINAKLAPAKIAKKLGISLYKLASVTSQPRHVFVLENLARLADVRAQMLVSEYRASAAVRLIEIATDSEGGETSRKACVDLLRADLGVFEKAPTSPQEEKKNAPPSEQAILDALQKLGEEALS